MRVVLIVLVLVVCVVQYRSGWKVFFCQCGGWAYEGALVSAVEKWNAAYGAEEVVDEDLCS